jgi:NifU-like protein involved in Fe-S cluster formation
LKYIIIMSKKEKILIGKTIEEAKEILRNYQWRIVKEDNFNTITEDLNTNRFNLYLEKGIIIDVKFF